MKNNSAAELDHHHHHHRQNHETRSSENQNPRLQKVEESVANRPQARTHHELSKRRAELALSNPNTVPRIG
jgi:hypothetical protein